MEKSKKIWLLCVWKPRNEAIGEVERLPNAVHSNRRLFLEQLDRAFSAEGMHDLVVAPFEMLSQFFKIFIHRAFLGFADEFVCKFGAIVCLDSLDLKRKYIHEHFQKFHGVFGGMFFKAIYKAYTGTFVYGCPLGGYKCLPSRRNAPLKQAYGTSFTSICTFSPGYVSSR